MDLNRLWHQRLQRHHQRLLRYSKYIFNDHFLLIIVVLCSYLALQYAQFTRALRGTTPTEPWQLLLAVLIGLWALVPNRLCTLVEQADALFLTVLGSDWKAYLMRGVRYSSGWPAMANGLVVLLAAPLLFAVNPQATVAHLVIIWFVLQANSVVGVLTQYAACYPTRPVANRAKWWRVVAGIAVAAIVWTVWSAPIALLFFGRLGWSLTRVGPLLDWQEVLHQEGQRLAQQRRLLQFFVDIPAGGERRVQRRQYLDALIQVLSGGARSVYHSLFARAFVRNQEYLALFVRLVGFGVLLQWVFQSLWAAVAVAVVFVLLLAVQLVPLYRHFDQIVWTHVYPVAEPIKKQAFVRLFRIVVSVQGLCYALALLALFRSGEALLAGVALQLGIWLALPLYINRKLG